MQLIIVFKNKPGNLGDPIKVIYCTGMGRGIVRPIQSLNEKAVLLGRRTLHQELCRLDR